MQFYFYIVTWDLYSCDSLSCFSGTLRKNRPMPVRIRDAEPQPGSPIDMRRVYFLCLAFRDDLGKKPVRLLSTALPAQDLVGGKPRIVSAYNTNMGAVDMDDGLLSAYGKQRKNRKVWKKVLLHIFQRIMLNAYVMYKQNTGNRPVLTRLQFIQ